MLYEVITRVHRYTRALIVAILCLAPAAGRGEDRVGDAGDSEGPALRLRDELPDETRVRIDVELPPDGAALADSPCGVFVAGHARALRGEVNRFDVAIVLDTSRSTIEPAEVV